MSFHHICLRTRLAPRRNPWAETARESGREHGATDRPSEARWRVCEIARPRSFSRGFQVGQSLCEERDCVSFERAVDRKKSRAERRERGLRRADSPVLSCRASSLSPRSATFVMFSCMISTVESICFWMSAICASARARASGRTTAHGRCPGEQDQASPGARKERVNPSPSPPFGSAVQVQHSSRPGESRRGCRDHTVRSTFPSARVTAMRVRSEHGEIPAWFDLVE